MSDTDATAGPWVGDPGWVARLRDRLADFLLTQRGDGGPLLHVEPAALRRLLDEGAIAEELERAAAERQRLADYARRPGAATAAHAKVKQVTSTFDRTFF